VVIWLRVTGPAAPVTLAVAVPAVPAMTPAASAAQVTASSTRCAARAPGPARNESHGGCPFAGLHGCDTRLWPQRREVLHRLRI